MKKIHGCFCKIPRFQRFSGFMELFSLRKIRRICLQHRGPGPPASAHGSTYFIKHQPLAFRSTAWIQSNEPVSRLLISAVHRRSDGWGGWLRPGGGGCSRLRRRVTVECGGSPESEFSRATVVDFWWGLLLRDHSDEGNVFMLTLISRERQRSPATVRRLGRCLSTVRAAFGEASAPRTCAKAYLSSLLASRLTNCSDRRRKTRIWWLPRVQWVLDLRPKICTICDAIVT
jgi:hypothetical protein